MDYFIFGEFMSCFIDFIDINLLEKYTLTNLVSGNDFQRLTFVLDSDRIGATNFAPWEVLV